MIREECKFYYPRESENVKERPKKEHNRNIRRLKREMQDIQEKIEYLSWKNPKSPRIKELQETLETGQKLLNLYGTEQKPQRRFRTKYKKCSVQKAYELICEYLASHKDQKFITKEELSHQFQIPQSRIEDAFRILNREGILSQPVHDTAHDTNRNSIAYCDVSGWASDIYYIRRKEETA